MQIGLLNAVKSQAQINMTGYYDYNKAQMLEQTKEAYDDLDKEKEKALEKYNKAKAEMSKTLLKINKKKDKLQASEDFTKKALKKFKNVDAFQSRANISRFFKETIGYCTFCKDERIETTPEDIDEITGLLIKRKLESRLADVIDDPELEKRFSCEWLDGYDNDYNYSICYQDKTVIPKSIHIQKPLDYKNYGYDRTTDFYIYLDETGLDWKKAKSCSPYKTDSDIIIENPRYHKD